jgi:pimeloyl-ACP methyl ester carboxylesterase
VVAAQLAIDSPATMQTLTLLEPLMLSMPSGEAVLHQVGPAFEAYGNGDHEGAWALFLTAATGLDWTTCRTVLETRIPGSVAQAVKDADTLFGVELPATAEWAVGTEQASAIRCPVLSVLGTDTLPLFVEAAQFLRSSIPRLEESVIEGVGHLLHIQRSEPVARAMAGFFGRHPMAGG